MSKLFKWFALIFAFICVFWWLSTEKPIAVDVVYADKGIVEATVANTRAGTITACYRARMSLPIGGQIAEIPVKEGQIVEQGQLLLSLWNKDKQAKLNEAKAILLTSQKYQQRACIVAENSLKDAQRQKTLLKQKLTSQEVLDSAIATSQANQASCEAAIADVEGKHAMVNTVIATIEQTYLHAPFKGTIAEITGEVGEYTMPSPPGVPTPPAVDLLTHDCHYVQAPIDEVDAADLVIGQPVRISLDAFRGDEIAGTLRRIAPYVQDYEKQARTVTIEVDLNEHRDPHFLAGYSADVEVILDRKENVLRLPTDLIINDEYVLILNDNDTIEQRPVTLGISNWQYSEILSGISATERVISSVGLSGVTAGVLAQDSNSID
ncbi:efflux RND transporter periplasmic adaptor subunit [Thalassomonas sp. M1454]|uniref:efflux RND transporter periplasmic adaptor subunit n=1 Tax=Thalassomonas sp. M1454 TaxID=2594477 RepID=UPI00117DB9F6|nr:efflux RND transporter periplasmic adaptor subunit [Thalassomonas sp. M1454]TRX57038.1 efflux RND transporter periplasmic adaptor subunit [Thalassomonas sp. M1454]